MAILKKLLYLSSFCLTNAQLGDSVCTLELRSNKTFDVMANSCEMSQQTRQFYHKNKYTFHLILRQTYQQKSKSIIIWQVPYKKLNGFKAGTRMTTRNTP